ncbi:MULTISPECIES: patatin-like phospholipase family protein [Psychrilyobacter]|uniref:Patatin n=1 Tax=Psychrilyobacter piezotolerans TaxID=2293438 RepID=A0ABX9KG62_9FUSO|nr:MULTISPECIES: patatin-like phospholipase family protein [Psychrilyobacter]MCS5420443.1 patatin-like phospholipase family protein [Psychrilyobacter sp. S5]NDI78222.1 patatin [Psychrilyobacter piezotolerans]RDE61216.1 patatin [Psychrilyobacter sp. S5]REI40884.1 patatin [Psychrilyobacter piezotolerans]
MKIGLALGSGSSRGWAHIGIIKALADLGIVPDIVCGTSIGALVGASYISGNLDNLEEWACSLTKFEIARFFEINMSLNGFIDTHRLHHFLNKYVAADSARIEDFSKQYASVATDLETGKEIWLTKGSVLEAVWSSVSLPGLFPAIKNNDRWLVDGGLVNPVPVSTCRALGADIVIAVDLNGDIVGKHFRKAIPPKKKLGVMSKINSLVREYTPSIFDIDENSEKNNGTPPNLFDAIASSVNITQDRITKSRMGEDPPDILLSPKLSHIKLLEFYRAREAMDEGRKCVQNNMIDLNAVLELIDRNRSS